jgi:hypothetical protein
MKIVEHARNIHVVELDAKDTNWECWVLLRSDAHWDNPKSNHELQRKHLDQVVLRNGLWFDGGDLFCAMQGKYDPRASKASLRPEHAVAPNYLDALVNDTTNFLSPYADRCIALGRGNHEQAILKKHETDLTERLAQSLTAKTGHKVHAGGYGGTIIFRVNLFSARMRYVLEYFHGSGGGGMMSFDTLRVRRQASFLPDADAVMCGHVHETWIMPLARKRLHNVRGQYCIEHDRQLHVRTGTYKDEYGDGHDGWHVERGGPPKSIGAVWMRLHLAHTGNNIVKKKRFCRLEAEFTEAR